MNKKAVVFVILIMLGVSMINGVVDVSADENYNDHSKEQSEGPGSPPEKGQEREEPRTRFKDS
ncbi:hypothetical protein GF319_03870 [Candidatus Bathyarchaeota archaeon]|nr:hypothetical protein [Candidatus Bathyarchaeota archaeon]